MKFGKFLEQPTQLVELLTLNITWFGVRATDSPPKKYRELESNPSPFFDEAPPPI